MGYVWLSAEPPLLERGVSDRVHDQILFDKVLWIWREGAVSCVVTQSQRKGRLTFLHAHSHLSILF
jgi:hypothetical protein